MLFPPRKPLETFPETSTVVQVKEWNLLASQAFCDIAECLSSLAFWIKRHRRAAI
jgi:hypothetical protein